MNSQVVTSFSVSGADLYGRRCVESFRHRCAVPMVVYVDEPMTIPGVELRETGAIHRWRKARKRLPNHRQGASRPEKYLWHARRFAVKPFVWLDAAERLGEGILTWLDGDTVTLRPIPASFFVDLLGDADVAFLGRGSRHPETGYVGFRVPQALPLLKWCRDAYLSGSFQRWNDGWTDCHALRAGLQAVPIPSRDLTSHLYAGFSHIWPVSPLAPYLVHHKGRKPLAVVA